LRCFGGLVGLVLTLFGGLGVASAQGLSYPIPMSGQQVPVVTMRLESPAFKEGEEIPARYTYQGDNISPPFKWFDAPAATKSFVFIIEDPDAPDPAAPKGIWVHWILYNIPPSAKGLAEGVKTLPIGVGEGINGWLRTGYGGPQPPVGKHRYFHKLYALDKVLEPSKKNPTREDLEEEMWGHVLAEATLMGTYQLKK